MSEAADHDADFNELADIAAHGHTTANPQGGPKAAETQWREEADDGRVLFQMDLWCSDQLISVLELDDQGNIVPTAMEANPLSPPGKSRRAASAL